MAQSERAYVLSLRRSVGATSRRADIGAFYPLRVRCVGRSVPTRSRSTPGFRQFYNPVSSSALAISKMALVEPPIDLVRTVSPYTDAVRRPRAASAQSVAVHLKDLLLPGKPFVLHLYTP
jgi:hypothetical protein